MKKSMLIILIFGIVLAIIILIGLFSFRKFDIFSDNKNNELEIENAEVVESSETEEQENLNIGNSGDEEDDSKEVEEELTFEETVWKYRIDKSMATSDCPDISKLEYPSTYYKGKLIDSHFHIPAIPDSSPGDEKGEEAFYFAYFGEDLDSENDEDEEEDSFDDQMPSLGKNIKMSEIVCTLKQESTEKVFAFFPVYSEIHKQMIEVVYRTMQQYPEYFVPFIMPPDNDNEKGGFSTVNAAVLQEMLGIYPGLFQGYGEIGLHAKEGGADELPPDSQRLLDIYPVIRQHNLVIYFHPGEDMEDDFEKVLEQNPDINFIVHGEQIEKPSEIGALMKKYPNIYFTVNDLYGDQYLLHPGENTKTFLAALANYEPLLRKDLATWKKLIEDHPDQFMWGTDRGGIAVWTLDKEVGQKLVDYARAFIGKLNPAVQEKFAYKNAERLLS